MLPKRDREQIGDRFNEPEGEQEVIALKFFSKKGVWMGSHVCYLPASLSPTEMREEIQRRRDEDKQIPGLRAGLTDFHIIVCVKGYSEQMIPAE